MVHLNDNTMSYSTSNMSNASDILNQSLYDGGPDSCLFGECVETPPPSFPPPIKREITDGLDKYDYGNISLIKNSKTNKLTPSMRRHSIDINDFPPDEDDDSYGSMPELEEESSDSLPDLCASMYDVVAEGGLSDVGPPPPPPKMERQTTLCIPVERDNLKDSMRLMDTLLSGAPPKMERQSTCIPINSVRTPYTGDPVARSPLTMRMFDEDGSPLTSQLLQERLGNLKKSLGECMDNIALVQKHYM